MELFDHFEVRFNDSEAYGLFVSIEAHLNKMDGTDEYLLDPENTVD